MGVPVPGMLEERLLQAERLTNTAAWNDQKLAEVVAGIQQVLEEIPPPSLEASAPCNPTITVTILYPWGATDGGATARIFDSTNALLGSATANGSGVATIDGTPWVGMSIKANAFDGRGCYITTNSALRTLTCADWSVTLTLGLQAYAINLTFVGCLAAGMPGDSVTLKRPDGSVAGTATTGTTGLNVGKVSFAGVIGPLGTWTATITDPVFGTQIYNVPVTTCAIKTQGITLVPPSGDVCTAACNISLPTNLTFTFGGASFAATWDATNLWWVGAHDFSTSNLGTITGPGACQQATIGSATGNSCITFFLKPTGGNTYSLGWSWRSLIDNSGGLGGSTRAAPSTCAAPNTACSILSGSVTGVGASLTTWTTACSRPYSGSVSWNENGQNQGNMRTFYNIVGTTATSYSFSWME